MYLFFYKNKYNRQRYNYSVIQRGRYNEDGVNVESYYGSHCPRSESTLECDLPLNPVESDNNANNVIKRLRTRRARSQ